LEAEGHRTIDVAFGRNSTTDTIVLSSVASLPERWRHVPGALPGYAGGPEFAFRYVAPNLSLAPPIQLRDFQLGQFEVTNAEYKRFVDAGGYRERSYWEHPFERDGKGSVASSTGRRSAPSWQRRENARQARRPACYRRLRACNSDMTQRGIFHGCVSRAP
jgi:formylglycine-generating enzyme required for sulfatase activity